MDKLLIKHSKGSKQGQVDEFPLRNFSTLTFGRDSNSSIAYEPDEDDLVSRDHARLERSADDPLAFYIEDLSSRNGTYVNKQRISGSTRLRPGDVVQLGPGGPAFEFDLDPRPEEEPKATRLSESMARPTREASLDSGTLISGPAPAKTGVGKATVERMLGNYQNSSRRTLTNLSAGLLAVVVLVGATLLYLNFNTQYTIDARMQSAEAKISQDMVTIKTSLDDQPVTPKEIAENHRESTVFFEVDWKLIHTNDDQQVFHRVWTGRNGKVFPSFIQLGGNVFPWLFLEDEGNNIPIGSAHTGSGFVVTDNGFVLTNRHVAATWHTRWDFPYRDSVVFPVDGAGNVLMRKPTYVSAESIRNLNWVPANESLLVERVRGKRNSFVVTTGPKRYEGRFDYLDVTFPKNKLRIPARLVRTSDRHDVALVKIDVPTSVHKVELHDSYGDSKAGEPITILGYPGASPNVGVRTKSQDPLNPGSHVVVVPDITVTGGLLGKIIQGEAVPESGAREDYISGFGDVFQLTANSTGAGNSGGPVFDHQGRVIGIFTYGRNYGGAALTFAVPIRFGLEIMGITPVLN